MIARVSLVVVAYIGSGEMVIVTICINSAHARIHSSRDSAASFFSRESCFVRRIKLVGKMGIASDEVEWVWRSGWGGGRNDQSALSTWHSQKSHSSYWHLE